MGDTVVTLEFNVPGPDAPGYLHRVRKALAFSRAFGSGMPTPEDLDDMVQFLVEFVTVPVDRNQATEALWMASENEFKALLEAVVGGGNDEAVPPSKGGPSVSG